ncbi:MAG: NnrU family protein [Gammaproteobacteria bacterium]
MSLLVLGIVIFIGMHSISIVNEGLRNRLCAKLGEGAWKGLYSVIAIVGFVLLIYGYGEARQNPIVLYKSPEWLLYVNYLLMLFVFPLFLAANLPGKIKAMTKHPLLAATKIWAFAHLLVNGTLADVILFGSFLAWAVMDRISMKHRTQRPIMAMPVSALNDVICIIVGLGIYAGFFFWLHAKWIGVSLPL